MGWLYFGRGGTLWRRIVTDARKLDAPTVISTVQHVFRKRTHLNGVFMSIKVLSCVWHSNHAHFNTQRLSGLYRNSKTNIYF